MFHHHHRDHPHHHHYHQHYDPYAEQRYQAQLKIDREARQQREMLEEQQLAIRRKEEVRRRAEEEQRKEEARRALQRQEIEKRALEDAQETHRLQVYRTHMDLIMQAMGLDFQNLSSCLIKLEPLSEPNPRFQATPMRGLPSILLADGKKSNLFDIIIRRMDLPPEAKIALFEILFTRCGYKHFAKEFFQSPNIDLLFQDIHYSILIKKRYLEILHNHFATPLPGIEEKIWRLMAISSVGHELFVDLLNSPLAPQQVQEKLLRYTITWFNSLPTPTDVIRGFRLIEEKLCGSVAEIFTTDILKIAKLRINALEIMRMMQAQQTNVCVHPDPTIKAFLGAQRAQFFLFRLGSTCSEDIYAATLEGELYNAVEMYNEELEKAEHTINDKLGHDHDHCQQAICLGEKITYIPTATCCLKSSC